MDLQKMIEADDVHVSSEVMKRVKEKCYLKWRQGNFMTDKDANHDLTNLYTKRLKEDRGTKYHDYPNKCPEQQYYIQCMFTDFHLRVFRETIEESCRGVYKFSDSSGRLWSAQCTQEDMMQWSFADMSFQFCWFFLQIFLHKIWVKALKCFEATGNDSPSAIEKFHFFLFFSKEKDDKFWIETIAGESFPVLL